MLKMQKNALAIDLSRSTLARSVSEYSLEQALANGVVVKVSSWVIPEMGFHPQGFRVHVVVTARLWKTIATVSPVVERYQTVRGRGDDVMWLAAYALRKAREVGQEAATFDAFIPTVGDEDVEGIKSLRVGWCEDGDKRWVMIGFPEEWATV